MTTKARPRPKSAAKPGLIPLSNDSPLTSNTAAASDGDVTANSESTASAGGLVDLGAIEEQKRDEATSVAASNEHNANNDLSASYYCSNTDTAAFTFHPSFPGELLDFCSAPAPAASADITATDSGVDLLGGFTSDDLTDRTPTVEKQDSTTVFNPFETITDGELEE